MPATVSPSDALGVALPCLLTAALAGAFTIVRAPLPGSDLPTGLLLVIALQAVGLALSRTPGNALRHRTWAIVLVATAVVLPIVALQAAMSRVPFVSLARGSAVGLISAMVVALIGLVTVFVMVCVLSADRPSAASILFAPVATLVPAVLGAPGDLGERSASGALAQAMVVAGIAVAVGTLLPGGMQPPIGAVALGGQFVALWLLGRGPVYAPDGGRIVGAATIAVIGTTVLLTVFAPLGALVARRFAQTVAYVEATDAAPVEEGDDDRPAARRASRPAPTLPPRSRSR